MNKRFLIKLINASAIQRWADKIRIIPLTEIDRHAHKMIITYIFGKLEEEKGRQVDWEKLIRAGIFELIRKIQLSDIKLSIYREIETKYPQVIDEVNDWVYQENKNLFEDVKGEKNELAGDFKDYLFNKNYLSEPDKKMIDLAYKQGGYWEFLLIKKYNPDDEEIKEGEKDFEEAFNKSDLEGAKLIIKKDSRANNLLKFIDMSGKLRLQIRWGSVSRIPETSVLGHSLVTAILAYLFSLEFDSCPKRRINNFFAGLFHDFGELVTRDIISPTKYSVKGMPQAVAEIGDRLMEEKIFPLLPEYIRKEMEYFLKNEFQGKIIKEGMVHEVSSDEISKLYNKDEFSPVDGELIKAGDHLSAALEAHLAKMMGINPPGMREYLSFINAKYKDKKIVGVDVGRWFGELETV